MQLHLERPDFAYFLRGADGRHALVNDRRLGTSFILSPDTLIEAWPPVDATALTPDDLTPLLALSPEVIVLGSGEHQAFPPVDVLGHCLTRGIGLETMTNAAAARTFNVLASEGRQVVAGFLIAPGTA